MGDISNLLAEVGGAGTLEEFLGTVLRYGTDRLGCDAAEAFLMDGACGALRPSPVDGRDPDDFLSIGLDHREVDPLFRGGRPKIVDAAVSSALARTAPPGEASVLVPVLAFGAPLALFRFGWDRALDTRPPAVDELGVVLGDPAFMRALLRVRLYDAQQRILAAAIEPGRLRDRAGEFLDAFRRAFQEKRRPPPATLNFQAVDHRRGVVRTLMADGLRASFRTIPAVPLDAQRPDIQAYIVRTAQPEIIVGTDPKRFRPTVFSRYDHEQRVRLWIPLFPLPCGEARTLREAGEPTLGDRIQWKSPPGAGGFLNRVGTLSGALTPPSGLVWGTLEVGYARLDMKQRRFPPLDDELASFCVAQALALCQPLYTATLFGALERMGRAAASVGLADTTEFTCFVRRAQRLVTWRYPACATEPGGKEEREAIQCTAVPWEERQMVAVPVFDPGQEPELHLGRTNARVVEGDRPAWERYQARVEGTLRKVTKRAVDGAFRVEGVTMRPHELQDAEAEDDPLGTRGRDETLHAVCRDAHLDSGATRAYLIRLQDQEAKGWSILGPAIQSPPPGEAPPPSEAELDLARASAGSGKVEKIFDGEEWVLAVPLMLENLDKDACVVLAHLKVDEGPLQSIGRWFETRVGTWTHRLRERQLHLDDRFARLMGKLRAVIVERRDKANRGEPGKKARAFTQEVLHGFIECIEREASRRSSSLEIADRPSQVRAALLTRQIESKAGPSTTLRTWIFHVTGEVVVVESERHNDRMRAPCDEVCSQGALLARPLPRGARMGEGSIWEQAKPDTTERVRQEIDRICQGDTPTTTLVLPVLRGDDQAVERAALTVLLPGEHRLRASQQRQFLELGGLVGDALAAMGREDQTEAERRHREAVEGRSRRMATASTIEKVTECLLAAMGGDTRHEDLTPWGLADDAVVWILDDDQPRMAVLATRGEVLPALERASLKVLPLAEHPLYAAGSTKEFRYRVFHLDDLGERLRDAYQKVRPGGWLLSFTVIDAEKNWRGIIDCLRSDPPPPVDGVVLEPLLSQLGRSISTAAELSRLRTVKRFGEDLFARTRKHLRKASTAQIRLTAIVEMRATLLAKAVDLYVERGSRMVLVATTRDAKSHPIGVNFYDAPRDLGGGCLVRAGEEPPKWAPQAASASSHLSDILEADMNVDRIILPREFQNAQGGGTRGVIYLAGPPSRLSARGTSGDNHQLKTGEVYTAEHLRLAQALALQVDRVVEIAKLVEREWHFQEFVHSLNQPLHVLRAHTEGLFRFLWNSNVPQKEVDEMEDRVEDAFQMVHLARDKLATFLSTAADVGGDFTEEDLGKLVENTCKMMRPMGKKRNIAVEARIKPGVLLSIDAQLLRLALMNLIENAIKYSDERKLVRVTLRTERPDGIQIEVSNVGLGIPRSDLLASDTDRSGPDPAKERDPPSIFLPYYRSNVPDNRGTRPGMGVGLALVWDAIVRVHGGHILVTSDPISGGKTYRTRFVIELTRKVLRERAAEQERRRGGSR